MVSIPNRRLIEELNSLATQGNADTFRATLDVIKQSQRTPAGEASIVRLLTAVTSLIKASDTKTLEAAASAPTDIAVLYRMLNQPDSMALLQVSDPLASARLRAIDVRSRLLASEGGTLSTEEVAQRLNLTRQAVDSRRKRGTLLAVQLGRRGYRFPVWQFSADGLLPGLEAMLRVLDEQSPWIHLAFVLNQNAWLDNQRPLDVLRAGDIDRVLEAARRYGEQNAA